MNSRIANLHVSRTEDEWRARLTLQEFRVLRARGTEMAFSGLYWDHHQDGAYACAGCGAQLFDSRDKFDSETGWPCFSRPRAMEALVEAPDCRYGLQRTEVQCADCGGHLGHVFDDGPGPDGRRYCVNSVCLKFHPRVEHP